MSSLVPTLILVGGGHAHIQVLHYLGKKKVRVQVLLVSDVLHAPYSGMLPGYLMGVYSEDDFHFNLRDICHRYGFIFIHDSVASINSSSKKIMLSGGKEVNFDFCSVNVGIQPARIGNTSEMENVIYVKPISGFIKKWNALTHFSTANSRISIVGGGAAGFEMAISCGIKFPGNKITLFTGSDCLLSRFHPNVRRHALNALKDLGISLIEGHRVTSIIKSGITLVNGESYQHDMCLLSTSAEIPQLIKNSDFPAGPEGFILVNEFLQIQGHDHMFGAGDCISFMGETLPKAGVFAVRQGPVLGRNILSRMEGKSRAKIFRPQKKMLSILVSGNKEAILAWGGLSIRSKFSFWIKNRIDRHFMMKFS